MKPNPASLEINAGISFLISRQGQRSPGRATPLGWVRTVTHLLKRICDSMYFLLTELSWGLFVKSFNGKTLSLSLRNPSTSDMSSCQQVVTAQLSNFVGHNLAKSKLTTQQNPSVWVSNMETAKSRLQKLLSRTASKRAYHFLMIISWNW